MKSEELLNEAVGLWEAVSLSYRDKMLELGRKLHLYVIESLREADEMSDHVRRKAGISRRKIIAAAASRLGVSCNETSAILVAAMVADTLAPGMDFGAAKHYVFRHGTRLIRRKCYAKRTDQFQTKTVGVSMVPAEEWEVNPDYPDAAEWFQKAIKEHQTKGDFLKAYHSYVGPNEHRGAKRQQKVEVSASIAPIIKVCSPRDAAEKLYEMIVESAEPKVLAERIAAMLNSPRFSQDIELLLLKKRRFAS